MTIKLPSIKIKPNSLLAKILLLLLIFALGAGSGYFYARRNLGKILGSTQVNQVEENKYLAFLMEVYDKIAENYWEKLDEPALVNLFAAGIEKLTGQPQNLNRPNQKQLEKELLEILKLLDSEEKKKEFTTKLADLVLANLKPFGRSRLYVKKDEIALKNTVQNKAEADYYQVLGIDKKASEEEIKAVAEEKIKQLETTKDQSPEAKEEYQKTLKAKEILTDPDRRQLYDLAGVEPTIEYRLISPRIFYLHLTKFSPTSLEELQRVTEKVDDRPAELDTLILDLRDNIGGAIDLLPYFLGPFIGQDQYAYQFFHQGEKTDFKTKIGWLPSLVRYKKVVILINENAQSSAEVVAATLKKYNVGVLVGTTTKGWGTVEKVFKLDHQIDPNEEYSVFLVHSLTLREDGQPIEGKGVDPVININDPNWKSQLYAYFNFPELVEAVEKLWQEF